MEQSAIIQTESRRRRFKPWDNIRRIFQRSSSKGSNPLAAQQQPAQGQQRPRLLSVFTMPRSRSTSELQATTTKVTPGTTSAPQPIPSSSNSLGGSGGGGGVTNAVGKGLVGAAGLSVSQDSVFAFEDSPGDSNYRGDQQQKQQQLQTQKQMMSELHKVIGSRTHRSADDDEGLPRSPVIALRHHLPSVTTSTSGGRSGLDSSISSPVYGSGGGSDPSLISINSCELEEASCDSLHSRNPSSSKVLIQRPQTAVEVAAADVQVDQVDGMMGMSSSSSSSAVPLSHNAALHKRAIRPKKSHAPARHRQLPQLATGSGGGGSQGSEFDIGIEDSFIVSAFVERKKGGESKQQFDHLLKPPLPTSPIKQRSLSLGRAVDSVIVSQQPTLGKDDAIAAAGAADVAAGPTAKVARSKSSVEKKFQHEVAGFWRRKEFNRLFKSGQSRDRDRSQENRSGETAGGIGEGEQQQQQQQGPPSGKRKDLRKIKKDKEEKRKRSDASGRSESPSPPAAFLSRFFGSRRSGRSRNNNDAINNKSSSNNKTETVALVSASGPVSLPPPETVQSTPPVPMPRSVFIHRSADHQEDGAGEELEVNWTMPSPSSPSTMAVGRTSVNSSGDRWIETATDTTLSSLSSHVRMPGASSSSLVSPKLQRKEQAVPPSLSPLPTRHHRIHIAGLSPYQRRVQRIGNGLQVTDDDDDDWDSPTDAPTTTNSTNNSYHFRRPAPANRIVVQRTSPLQLQQQHLMQDVTASTSATESLPVNINHEFILKRASPPSASASDNIRRSLEVLKFSNEGLKKTIDSLNQQQQQHEKRRMSQSSDQLQLSDSCSNKRDESSAAASRSNSTSSLNISDVADDPAAIDTGLSSSIASLAHSVDEKDVHDDVLIVDDHREKNEQYRWSPVSVPPQSSPLTSTSSSSDDNNKGGVGGAPSSSRSWENRQMAVPQQQPMFSMSVRVQNPPSPHDVIQYKYKRSVSSPCNENEPKSLHCDIGRSSYQSSSSGKPFISSSSPPRPWQSKEEKERQNKWALISPSADADASGDGGDESIKATPSLLMLMDMNGLPPDVKLRPKKTSAAMSVTAGGVVIGTSQQQQQQETSELLKVFARRSLKVRDSQEILVEDVGVAAESLADEPEVIQQGSIATPLPPPPDSPKKKNIRPMAIRPPLTSIRSPSVANESNLLIRLPQPPSPLDSSTAVKAERGSYSLTSPTSVLTSTSGSSPHPFSEQQPSAHEDIIWKRLSQTKNYQQRAPIPQQPNFISDKLPVKNTNEETKSTTTPSTPATNAAATTAAPQGRQSKVLAMVNNIQRLHMVT